MTDSRKDQPPAKPEKPAAPLQGEALLAKYAALGKQSDREHKTQDHEHGCGCGCGERR